MLFRTLLLFCLLAGCSSQKSEPAPPEPAAHETSTGAVRTESTKPTAPAASSRDQQDLQCAMLKLQYEAERNQLLGGDRSILREQLTKIGQAYAERMKAIPNCTFSIL